MKKQADRQVWQQIEQWYEAIAAHVATQQPELTVAEVNQSTQQLINSILCTYLCENPQLIFSQNDSAPLSSLHLQSFLKQFSQFTSTAFQDLSIDTLAQVHERLFSPSKKTQGIYYTPPAVIDDMVQQTLGQWRDRTLPQVLDPACGGGAFLLAAYQFLLDAQLQFYLNTLQLSLEDDNSDRPKLENSFLPQPSPQIPLCFDQDKWRLTRREGERILLHCIYGVDLDPQAVEVTKLSLWLKLLENTAASESTSLPDLSSNIHCGNALLGSDFITQLPAIDSHLVLSRGFDWVTAFPASLSQGGFDIVLGNPPYIDAESMTIHFPHWRHYCSTRYRTATGNWDIFCLFIEKALELCRPGGLHSFIVPNKLAAAEYAAMTRSLLSDENQLLSLRDYSQEAVFTAAIYPLVYVVKKLPPPPQPVLKPAAPWLLSNNSHQSRLLHRLRDTFPTLGTIAQVSGAATVAEAYQLQPLIVDRAEAEPGDLQLVNSGTIDRYRLLWGIKPLRYLGTSYQFPRLPSHHLSQLSQRRQDQAKRAKIIVAGMTQTLECALDSNGSFIAGKSTSIIYTPLDLRYLLGLLNSRLINFFFTNLVRGNGLQGGYLRVGPPQLRQLPICAPQGANDQTLIAQVIEMQTLQAQRCPNLSPNQQLQLRYQIEQLDTAINQTVYQLYGLSDREIEVVSGDRGE
jgi:hypothetical protein